MPELAERVVEQPAHMLARERRAARLRGHGRLGELVSLRARGAQHRLRLAALRARGVQRGVRVRERVRGCAYEARVVRARGGCVLLVLVASGSERREALDHKLHAIFACAYEQ
jgi:hypothetical protein